MRSRKNSNISIINFIIFFFQEIINILLLYGINNICNILTICIKLTFIIYFICDYNVLNQ